ncbi:uncharacterized protein [Euwallacea fornicatus]|uniref:uncharacterized protein isoform X1 n=1 Tax=Euwallacea fornicatus TaxID=995702 RepID=UPI0033903724
MVKTSKSSNRMDRYFKTTLENTYTLSMGRKGAMTTIQKTWDGIRRLSRKLVTDNVHTREEVPKGTHYLDHEVQLLPRKDVMIYGTIPAMEERVFSYCKNCGHVFNPFDILSHKSCSRSHMPHLALLKKKVQAKNGSNKKLNNGNSSSQAINSALLAGALCGEGSLDFEFKRPFTPPPVKAAKAAARSTLPSMLQLKVSVTKIGLSKSPKTTTVTTPTTTSTTATSKEKTDSIVSSSKTLSTAHHAPKGSSGHHSSRSAHIPKSPSTSSSGHHTSKNPSNHHSPRSPSSSSTSHHTSKSPSSVQCSPRSPSKSGSHHGSTHRSSSSSSSSSSHHSKSSPSKTIPMDTSPPATPPPSHHLHSHRHKRSSSGTSKRGSSGNSISGISGTSSSGSKILPKTYDPDTHCGVIEGNRGPCMRPIICSNHRLHLRKQVAGRSKDIHQLIAERKAAKENDLKHTTVPCTTPPNSEAKSTSSNTTYVAVVSQVASTTSAENNTGANSFVHILPRISTHHTELSTATSVLAKKPPSTEVKHETSKVFANGCITRAKSLENTQGNAIGTVPVVIMPVSPVSVVSSVQLLKIGNNIISLESPQSASKTPARKQVVLPIPSNHLNGVRMYKSHPKPIILPNFGARKLGGAILLANRLLEDQRNDLLSTIDLELKKLETVNIERGLSGLNHSNSPHSPNTLKGKGGVKVNCKRPATDKLTTGFSKRLVSDVNGFIIHADVSESTDAMQYSGENELSQHESIIRLIDQHGF